VPHALGQRVSFVEGGPRLDALNDPAALQTSIDHTALWVRRLPGSTLALVIGETSIAPCADHPGKSIFGGWPYSSAVVLFCCTQRPWTSARLLRRTVLQAEEDFPIASNVLNDVRL
jgi:hypothetical protein